MEIRRHARLALVAAVLLLARLPASAQEYPPPVPMPGVAPPALPAPPPTTADAPPSYQLQPPALRPPVVERRPMYGLVIGGAVTLGVPWFISVLSGAILELGSAVCRDVSRADCSTGAWALFIPVAGPFVLLARTEDDNLKALLAVDGAVQIAGLALMIVGAVVRRPVEVRTAGLTLAPYVAGGGSGLMLRGTF